MAAGHAVKLLIDNPNVRQQFEKKLFRSFDANRDGKIQPHEAWTLTEDLCKQVGLDPPRYEHVKAVFKSCDLDNSGWLGLSQFDSFLKFLHKIQRDKGNDAQISFGLQPTEVDTITVQVQQLNGDVLSYAVEAEETVLQLKAKITEGGEVPAHMIELLLDTQVLLDSWRVSGFCDGSVLQLLKSSIGLHLFQKVEDRCSMRLLLDHDGGKCRLAHILWSPPGDSNRMEYHSLVKGTFVMDGDTVVCTWEKRAVSRVRHSGVPWECWEDKIKGSTEWARLSLSDFQQIEKMSESKRDLKVLEPSDLSLGLFRAHLLPHIAKKLLDEERNPYMYEAPCI